jgi:predicted ATPase
LLAQGCQHGGQQRIVEFVNVHPLDKHPVVLQVIRQETVELPRKQTTDTQLLGQLAEKKLLLILDNIEQFLKVASDLIVELLAAGNGVHLLATSRTTLPLAASVSFPLSGLKIPTQTSIDVLQNESVRLFAERASRLPSSFDLEKHLAEVVAICQFLEGMPLGIELAAASVGRLLIGEVMPALKNNLRLVNSSRSDLPSRQRALQAEFDNTWK